MGDLDSKNDLINELEQAVHKFSKSAAQCDDYDLQENMTNESNNDDSNTDSDSGSEEQPKEEECNNGTTGSCGGTPRNRVVVGE